MGESHLGLDLVCLKVEAGANEQLQNMGSKLVLE
jgi:hypothetical protein